MSDTFQYGYVDFEVVVSGGVGQSQVYLGDRVYGFAVKCGVGLQYRVEFRDKDGFGVWAEDDTSYQGPVCRAINRKCRGFQVFLTGATDGVYLFRVSAE